MNMVNENNNTYIKDEYSYDEIIENIKREDTSEFSKIFSLIDLDNIKSEEDAHAFINLLTNQTNPIREIVSYKLEDVFHKNPKYFLNDFSKNKILNGIIDINPNVSRSVCSLIQNSPELQAFLELDIILRIEEVFKSIKEYEKEFKDYFDKSIRNTKNHAKNKKLFALYWLLEALSFCKSEKYNSRVLDIVKYTMNFEDYTIREKTAKILTKMKNISSELLQKAKSDQNFYVKIQVYDKMNIEE